MKYILPICLVFLLLSCEEAVFEKIDTPNFSIELPNNMTETTNLNDDAILQYQNPFSELYTIVIEEEFQTLKEDFPEFFVESTDKYAGLTEYSNLIVGLYSTSDLVKNEIHLNKTKINGALAIEVETNKISEGHNVYMKFTFIKGKNHFYQIVVWTLADSKLKFKKEFDTIGASFIDKGSKKINRSKK